MIPAILSLRSGSISQPAEPAEPQTDPADLTVGLADNASAEAVLRDAGIDPDRLAIQQFGGRDALQAIQAPWVLRLALAVGLWLLVTEMPALLPAWLRGLLSLTAGLLFIQAACDAIIMATERLAARLRWNHYVAGTLTEMLSTLPELVVIAFVVLVDPNTAFIIALITIYNNAFVFSIYSFFLPKDQQGKFVMPVPITEAGTQILIAGAAIGLTLGLVMIAFNSGGHPKQSFSAADLIAIGLVLLAVFGVYVHKLLRAYAREEDQVADSLELSASDLAARRALVYANVPASGWGPILALFLAGIAGSLIGGHQVAAFAAVAVRDLQLNSILTALLLAVFAGMSEYVILWKSHRRGEYGIALANAFGGITQVMFLVLPFTLIAIGLFQFWSGNAHPDLPLAFSLPNILLLLFIFPTFFVLIELLEEDHTLGTLDTTIMAAIFLLLIVLLVTYGADAV